MLCGLDFGTALTSGAGCDQQGLPEYPAGEPGPHIARLSVLAHEGEADASSPEAAEAAERAPRPGGFRESSGPPPDADAERGAEGPGRPERGAARQSRRERVRVWVHVYDLGHTPLTRGLNKVNKQYGAYHTGVEVYGAEWSFGMTFDGESTGVTCSNPRLDPDHAYRESVDMGFSDVSAQEFFALVERLQSEWPGSSYNMLTRNCHHFSDTLCKELGVGPLPEWCNALADSGADTGAWFSSDETDFDGGEAVLDLFGGVAKALGLKKAPQRN